MADEKNIQQDIILNYKTNALNAAKEVDALNNAYENVNDEKVRSTNETKKEEQAYKSMKAQIREATQEQQRLAQMYGVTSKEALKAAQNLAQLKDEMDEAKDYSDAFNPDQKMTALATSAKVAGIGMQGVTSGMALFGEANEETEKQILKVQAAMAFSDAVSGIFDMAGEIGKLEAQAKAMWIGLTTSKTADTVATEINTASNAKGAVTKGAATVATTALTGATTFSTIATTAATIATNIFNASLAILTAPIFLVVAGIAALVLGIGYLTGAFGDFSGEAAKAEQANKKLSSEIDKLSKANEKANEQMAFSASAAIAMAKAQGKSAEEVRKLKEELINQEVAEKRLNAVKAYSIYLEAQRVAGLEDATDAQKETAKKATEFYQKTNGDYNNSLKARRQMAIDHKVEIVQEETQKNKELEDKRKEAAKKEADERKRKHEEELKERQRLKDELKKLEDKYIFDIENLKDKTDEQKLARQKARDLEEIEALRKKGEDVSTLLKLNSEKYAILEEELRLKRVDEKAVKDKEEADKKAEDAKAAADKEIEIAQAIADQKAQLEESRMAIADKGVAFLSQIAGKNKALQKAAIIAENAVSIGKTLIANAAGNAQAIAQGTALGVTDPTAPARAAAMVVNNNVSTALGVATSIAATAKALSALGGGGGASGGGSASGMSAPSGGNAPQVQFQNSSENQIATSVAGNINEQPPVQAFVVSSEVTTAQQLDRNRIDSNSF